MKICNRVVIFILTLHSVFLIISCDQQARRSELKSEDFIHFDTISLVEQHHLDGDTANPYCNIKVEFIYPITDNKMSLESLQHFFIRNTFGVAYDSLSPSDAVQAYVQNYIENYTADSKLFRKEADEYHKLDSLMSVVDMSDSEHISENFFYSYYESITDSIVYNQHGVLAFQVRQSNNKGGAASYDSYRNYVLNLLTGKPVTEDDIFNAGYDAALQNLIINSLLDQTEVKSVEELEDLGFFGVREIIPNSNFLLNDKGIIYTYNKGEYSAYQLDAPEVFIPYVAIQSLLKEQSVAYKLANLK